MGVVVRGWVVVVRGWVVVVRGWVAVVRGWGVVVRGWVVVVRGSLVVVRGLVVVVRGWLLVVRGWVVVVRGWVVVVRGWVVVVRRWVVVVRGWVVVVRGWVVVVRGWVVVVRGWVVVVRGWVVVVRGWMVVVRRLLVVVRGWVVVGRGWQVVVRGWVVVVRGYSLYSSVRSPFPSQLALEVLGSGSCSAPIPREEWDRQCRKGGSEATSRDEFPNAVVKLLSGFATEVILQWSRQLRTGVHSFFLHAALHVCLLKKEPYWLIRNSRPIILEPDIRRKESSAMFQRFMSRGEATGFIPPWTFSYRKEITPLFLAILVRWFTAYWALNNGHIYCGDWDESNAFCNVSRPSLSEVLQENPSLDVGEWVDWFFSSFQVFLQTPYGLAPPYRLKQGGTQGDSMGVGSYMIPRILRSLALYRKVPAPEHPGLPGVRIPELIFSDDGR